MILKRLQRIFYQTIRLNKKNISVKNEKIIKNCIIKSCIKKNKNKTVNVNDINIIQKIIKFKKRLSIIEYEFTLYILKKIRAYEQNPFRDCKQTFETNINVINFQNLLLKKNDVFNNIIINNINEYIIFKKHKRKIITKNIVMRNLKIFCNTFYDERLNNDNLINIKLRNIFKKVHSKETFYC